jgi:hypothetical protein
VSDRESEREREQESERASESESERARARERERERASERASERERERARERERERESERERERGGLTASGRQQGCSTRMKAPAARSSRAPRASPAWGNKEKWLMLTVQCVSHISPSIFVVLINNCLVQRHVFERTDNSTGFPDEISTGNRTNFRLDFRSKFPLKPTPFKSRTACFT